MSLFSQFVVLQTKPHNVNNFTQGLFFSADGKKMYESVGLYGESAMILTDFVTGAELARQNIVSNHFAEGACLLRQHIYQLTWREGIIYVRDATTLAVLSRLAYPRIGWGLTTDGTRLIASDGSSKLYYMNTQLQTLQILTVKHAGMPVGNLNELEWMPAGTLGTDALILANRWLTPYIYALNPKNGLVVARWNFQKLTGNNGGPDNVLNGIARRATDAKGVVWITGKRWSKIYQVKLSL